MVGLVIARAQQQILFEKRTTWVPNVVKRLLRRPTT
jgi:hypothetical protein